MNVLPGVLFSANGKISLPEIEDNIFIAYLGLYDQTGCATLIEACASFAPRFTDNTLQTEQHADSQMKACRYHNFLIEPDDRTGRWRVIDPFDQYLGDFATLREARSHVDDLAGGSRLAGVFGVGFAALIGVAIFKLFVMGGLAPLLHAFLAAP